MLDEVPGGIVRAGVDQLRASEVSEALVNLVNA
jgi:hypothetical protein